MSVFPSTPWPGMHEGRWLDARAACISSRLEPEFMQRSGCFRTGSHREGTSGGHVTESSALIGFFSGHFCTDATDANNI